jgi:anthranilate synthase/aminodeoxychorismate synthase-like glutamine amidotransferase
VLHLIDNYDSFTYNLVQYFGELGHLPRVVKNDGTTVEALAKQRPEGFVLSPGPGGPADSGICLDVIRRFAGTVPILGICLGHQAIAHVFGAKIGPAGEVAHGKVSEVEHDGAGVFRGLPSPLRAGRYHSLAVDGPTLPPELVVSAFTRGPGDRSREIMGLRHAAWPIEGVQFHPESILTEHGHALLRNFCDILSQWAKPPDPRPGASCAGGSSGAAT